MAVNYYAHSHPSQIEPGDKWQKLAPHLQAVAEMAQTFAADAILGRNARFVDASRVAGLLHDLGKYRDEFQQKIQGKTAKKVAHAIHGASYAAKRGATDAAFGIAGHHGGIPSLVALLGAVNDCNVDAVWRVATEDMAELRRLVVPRVPTELIRNRLRAEVWIRLLFSCLVDADFLDTERHFDPDKSAQRTSPPLNPTIRLSRLCAAVEALAYGPMPEHVRHARRRVFTRCLEAAHQRPGFFSLTVPTGGGKTLASMAFALKHADLHGLRRVIYVLPYLNIIEQNAAVLREVFGKDSVLEHHSLADESRQKVDVLQRPQIALVDDLQTPPHRLAAENWDATIIVTTNVQFFESLFANLPAQCRKLHRIPRSVVILDECQTLPPGLLVPVLSMLETLVVEYGTTVVFCTATQPAFRCRPGFDAGIAADRMREIVPDHSQLFHSLRRTSVQWPASSAERTGPSTIAARIVARDQALCVVNLRRHAAELYRLVAAQKADGVFHLSTNLCPAHRLDLLSKIRARLDAGDSCRVIATQLVEAGVDLDFPYVARALGPLDSIAQAAGRCNREGKLKDAAGNATHGLVEVFVPEDDAVASGVYRLATDKTRALLEYALANGQSGPDIHDPASFEDYFRRLYADTSLDAKDLQTGPDSPRHMLDFPQTAADFEMIPKATVSVIISYDDNARKSIGDLRGAIARMGFPPATLIRSLQRYFVQRWPHEFAADRQDGRVEPLAENLWLWTGPYDVALGVDMADEKVVGPDAWIV